MVTAERAKIFLQFFWSVGMAPPWPVEVDRIVQFVVNLQDKGLAAGSIRSKLASLAFFRKAWGCSDPKQDFRVRKLIEGWSKFKRKQLTIGCQSHWGSSKIQCNLACLV